MKKFTSFLLMLTMLISIIYLPGLTFNISAAYADDVVSVTLPEGTMSTSGSFEDSISGYTEISTAAQFKNITYGHKYYLSKNIDLTASGVNFAALSDFADATIGGDTSKAIILDGRGHEIKTNRPLFRSLANGSEIRNLVVQGAVTSPDYNTYSGWCLGAVATRSYGTTFKNILNQASVTYTNTSSTYIRTGGLVGMALIGTTIFQNCKNTGNVTMGKTDVVADDTTRGGAGGILGYAHNGSVLMANCHNQSKVINNLKTNYDSAGNKIGAYAGGLVGVKGTSATLCIALDNVDDNGNTFNPVYSQSNTSADYTITGKSAQSTYCPNVDGTDPKREIYVGELYRLSSGSEFISLSGNGKYYLTKNISIDNVQSHNVFSGKIYGLNRTITCTEPPFADMSKFTSKNLTIRVNGWTEIKTAADFLAIKNDGSATDWNGVKTENKYYISAPIDLATPYPNWKGPSAWIGSDTNREKATNDQPTITLDGCGFTIKTAKPIFPELPGGGKGNDGTHSIIRNLVVEGNVTVNSGFLTEYNNGYSAGALVGKSNGGIYENITNKANVTLTSEMGARVGGIIGSVFNDDIVMNNCVNHGNVIAPVSGTIYGAGGIVALIGYNENGSARGVNAKFINCTNQGSVTNNPKNTSSHVYAGGIVGVKYTEDTIGYIIDCVNSGKIFARTAYGSYYADRLQQNLHIIKTTPITTEEEFMRMSGKKAYSLANDITITNYNTNVFEGFLVGNGHTVTTPERLFYDDSKANLIDVEINPTNLVINGRKLESYAIVATAENKSYATSIQTHISTISDGKITPPIYTPADNYTGNAIYINLGNNYYNVTDDDTSSGKHKTRFGFDYGINDNGYFEIYLDGKDEDSISAIVTDFITNKLPTGKSTTGYDFFAHFGDKTFNYVFGDGLSSGIVKSRDVVRPLDDGVQFIERTYKNANNVSVEVCILVIEAGADVHLEVAAAQTTAVSNCSNSAKCNNVHVNPSAQKTVSEFASSVEAQGKEVIAAINGGFFMKSAGCNIPWGLVMVDGTAVHDPWAGDGGHGSRWFGVTYDGTPVCGDHNSYSNYESQLQYAVDGKYYLIKNGSYVHHVKSINGNTDARTAVGFNADGDIVIVSVAGNDKDTKHPGLSLADMSQVFMDLDMDITYALNLDGGGSTAMMVDNANGILNLETPQYSSGVTNSEGKTDLTAQRKISDALILVRNK